MWQHKHVLRLSATFFSLTYELRSIRPTQWVWRNDSEPLDKTGDQRSVVRAYTDFGRQNAWTQGPFFLLLKKKNAAKKNLHYTYSSNTMRSLEIGSGTAKRATHGQYGYVRKKSHFSVKDLWARNRKMGPRHRSQCSITQSQFTMTL